MTDGTTRPLSAERSNLVAAVYGDGTPPTWFTDALGRFEAAARVSAGPAPLDGLRPVIEKASAIQQQARRSAISNEDWRYTNGYNNCLAAVLSVLDPEDSLRWVRDPVAEYARLPTAPE